MAWTDIENNNNGNSVEIEYTKVKPGEVIKIRILDREPFSRWTHWLPKQQRTITCAGKDCPICAVMKAQKENKEEATYSSSRRHILHVWNYTTNRLEFFEQGNTVFIQLASFHKMLGDITTCDFKVMRTGEKKDTKYTFLPEGVTPTAETILKEYQEKKVDFVERHKAPEVDDVKKLMAGATFDEVYGSNETTPNESHSSNDEEPDFTV